MKTYLNYFCLFAVLITLMSCGPTLSGRSKKDFDASKKKVEQTLTKQQDSTLEIALRVIVGEAIRRKMEQPDNYKEQSLDDITLKMIDGRTYSSVVSEAEDFLKAGNERKTASLSHEIDSLEKQRSADMETRKSAASLFKIDQLKLEQQDFFGKQTPRLDIDYLYIGKQPLVGQVQISVELYKAGTQQMLTSVIWGQGDASSKLAPGESINDNLLLSDLAEKEPQKWNAVKYPVDNPDLQSLGLRLEVHPIQFNLNGKQISVTQHVDTALIAQINEDIAELKDVQASKGTLDEL
jgi:hypothetical protein